MLLTLLQFFATKFLFLALHLESGCFPRPLTAREEAAAFSALRAGDAAAREKLIRHNLRLVAHIVKKYYALPGDQEDLVSIGTIGLMKAVDTFDATRKARFSTYASRCIENEIRMQFRRERKSGQTVSLQEALEADGDSALTLADVIQDGFCMEECCEKKADLLRVRQLLETLPARERQILLLRYGLAGQPPLTQLETAGLLGISRSYVSRLETHALELLRQDPQVSRLSVDENKIAAWFSGSREEEAYLLQKLVDAGILVVSFAREHNSLESLFFHLTGETEQKSRNTETFGNTIG